MQKDLLTHIMQLSSRWPKRPFSRDFYSAVASVLALMGFCFCAMADASNVIRYAPNPPYDNIPITPKTWEEVDLIYYSTISGHRYTNAIQLLRPIEWLHKLHMDIIGGKVTLSMPEFGIVNVLATVKGIKPTRVDTRGVDWSKQNNAPVIGKFMRYVTDVRTYTFIDSQWRISHINATPNHPFYVKNKHGFVAIGNVSDDDTLVGGIGSGDNHIDGAIHLVCAKGKHSHCGVAYGGNGLPILVYNFEVYKRHVYRVGGSAVVVHNMCAPSVYYNQLNEKKLVHSVIDENGKNTVEFKVTKAELNNAKPLHHNGDTEDVFSKQNKARLKILGFEPIEMIQEGDVTFYKTKLRKPMEKEYYDSIVHKLVDKSRMPQPRYIAFNNEYAAYLEAKKPQLCPLGMTPPKNGIWRPYC